MIDITLNLQYIANQDWSNYMTNIYHPTIITLHETSSVTAARALLPLSPVETAEKNVYWSQWAIFSWPTHKERYSRHKAWHQLLCVIYYSMCGPRADSCVDIALLGTSLQEDVNCLPCLHLGPIPHAPCFPVSTLAWHCYCCLFPAATVLAGDVSILWVCVCHHDKMYWRRLFPWDLPQKHFEWFAVCLFVCLWTDSSEHKSITTIQDAITGVHFKSGWRPVKRLAWSESRMLKFRGEVVGWGSLHFTRLTSISSCGSL